MANSLKKTSLNLLRHKEAGAALGDGAA